ncbi:CybS-domain-containing protein [Zopfochytrium polystomum]|nr:CybS-domain-containing protein [Zopfochytrium polystomum]
MAAFLRSTAAPSAARLNAIRTAAGSIARLQTSAVARSGPVATVHPPVTYQQKSKSAGSYHWDIERALSLVSVPLIATAFIAGPIPAVDLALGVVIPIHTHIGFDACIQDYVHERKYGVLQAVAKGALYAGTGLTLYGLYQFNTKDVGITQFIADLWHGPKKA